MKLVGKSELAKLANVSPAAVTKAVKSGRLRANQDGRIDADAPESVEFISGGMQRQRRSEARSPIAPKSRAPGGGRKPFYREDDDEDSVQSDIVMKRKLELEVLKQKALTAKLRNAADIGTVVLREDVIRGIIGPIETAFVRLLTDVSKTIAGRVTPMALNGSTVEEIEAFIREQHSVIVRNLKKHMKKALKNGDTEGQ